MEVLESPLDSLVRTLYLSAALTSFCTWFSVHAATICLWVRRFFSPASDSCPRLKPSSCLIHKQADSTVISAERTASCLSTTADEKSRVCWRPREEASSVRKGRFTTYYCSEDVAGMATDWDEEEEEEELTASVSGGAELHARSLILPVRRTGDLGWYRSQDMRVFDGSVVRFWKGGGLSLESWPMAMR